MNHDADVIVIGAGGGGAVVAKELGEKGIKVLVLEAGPGMEIKNGQIQIKNVVQLVVLVMMI
jgi:choline dehydrogenase-like flavoprotein